MVSCPRTVIADIPEGGADIVKRNKQRSHRHLFVLPGQLAPLSGTVVAAAAAAAAGASAGGSGAGKEKEKDGEEAPNRQIVRRPYPRVRHQRRSTASLSH